MLFKGKKKILGLAAALFLTIAPLSSGALANSNNTPDRGFEIVDASSGLISSNTDTNKIQSRSLTSGGFGGGYWIRGKKEINSADYVYSSFKHYTQMGRASVTNGNGESRDGYWQAKNVYSTAAVYWTSKGTNKSYYDSKAY